MTGALSRCVFCVFVLLLAGAARASDTPPVRSRPLRFSGAVGTFRVALSVERQEVHVEEPFLLTVRISAAGPVGEPPMQPKLGELTSFTRAFHIESLPASGGQSEKDVWEFRYRLRAKSTAVEGVPSLPFIYYRPATRPGSHGAYLTTYGPSVSLTVKPPEPPPVTQREGEKPVLHPESVHALITGPDVLQRSSAWQVSVSIIVSVLIAAPLGCAVWYRLWKRMNPDAARRAQRRRSLAARQALAALATVPRRPAADRPRLAAEAVATFLRHRLELGRAVPSPDEVETHLKQIGLGGETVAKVVTFFRSADAARFAPDVAVPTDWFQAGREVVSLVEGEACSPS